MNFPKHDEYKDGVYAMVSSSSAQYERKKIYGMYHVNSLFMLVLSY
jgi:hypothetical protein